jgi:hypothetical protein
MDDVPQGGAGGVPVPDGRESGRRVPTVRRGWPANRPAATARPEEQR